MLDTPILLNILPRIQFENMPKTSKVKKKVKKVKVWSKKNTFDHEQNIDSYLVEFKKLESIFFDLACSIIVAATFFSKPE